MATTLKRPPSPVAPANPESHLSPITPADRKTRGKQLRDPYRVPGGRMRVARTRSAFFAPWMRPGSQNWCPLRCGRISPFTFYRGSAGVMAADLARTPAMGIHVQACGNAHLLNFGGSLVQG